MRKRVIKNIFSSWGMFSLITAIRFFLTPLFIHKLGNSDYGIWILILSLIGYMELLNIGLNTANVRYLSKYLENKDEEAANEIFNSGFLIFLTLGGLILLLTLSITPILGSVFSFLDDPKYLLIFIIAGINLAFEFAFYSFSSVVIAKQEYYEVNIINASVFIVRSIVAVVLLLSGFKLLAIVLNQSVFNIIRGLIISGYALKTTPSLKLNLRQVKQATLKKIANLSVYIFIVNITQKINLHAGALIIAFFMAPSAITFFAIANNLVIYLQNFISAIPRVLIPRFSQLDASDNYETIRGYYLSFTRITLIISIPIVFIFIFYGKSLISLWIGDEYADLSGSILAILSVGHLCRLSQLTAHSLFKVTGRHKQLAYFTISESIVFIIMSLFLIRSHGLIGLAYAQAGSMVFFNLFVMPAYVCRELKIAIGYFYMNYIFKNILGLVPLFLIYYSFQTIKMDSIPLFGMTTVVIMGIFLGLSYFFILNVKEKEIVNQLVRLK